MPNFFSSIFADTTTATVTFGLTDFLISAGVSLLLGCGIALLYFKKAGSAKSFAVTLALLPLVTHVVIILVNGNLGTGIAVMGAFNLVRFRSLPGSASDITAIFLAMAIGLAAGMGYIVFAVVFFLIYTAAYLLLSVINPKGEARTKQLRITIPEDLDYSEIFDDLFKEYTKKAELQEVKTTAMGSLFQLTYTIIIADEKREKQFLDKLRCRNGNLAIAIGRVATDQNRL